MTACPEFSVVVPTWNRHDELLRAVRSVIAQEFQDWELIVVDDGSEDQAAVVSAISGLGDQRVRTIALPTHRNAAHARNVGIRAAHGRWVAFLDSDDVFVPGKLGAAHLLLRERAGEAEVVLYSQFIQRMRDKDVVTPTRGIRAGEPLGDYLFSSRCSIGTPGVVVSQSLAAKLLFREQCVKHQDYDLLLRAEAAGVRFVFLQQPLWIREYRASQHNVGAAFLPAFSCWWFNEYRQYLSADAQIGFLEQAVLGPCVERPWSARLAAILTIILKRGWPRGHLAGLLWTLLPYQAFQRRLARLKARTPRDLPAG